MHHTTSDVLENFLMEACTHCTKIQHYLFNCHLKLKLLHYIQLQLIWKILIHSYCNDWKMFFCFKKKKKDCSLKLNYIVIFIWKREFNKNYWMYSLLSLNTFVKTNNLSIQFLHSVLRVKVFISSFTWIIQFCH